MKILSPRIYPFRKMVLFNLVSQRSKVQLAPLTGNIYNIKDGHANSEIEYCQQLYHTFLNLRNSGAKYVSNKMPRQYQNFSVCLGNISAKKLLKTRQKPSYITSTMASAYLGIIQHTKGYNLVL